MNEEERKRKIAWADSGRVTSSWNNVQDQITREDSACTISYLHELARIAKRERMSVDSPKLPVTSFARLETFGRN